MYQAGESGKYTAMILNEQHYLIYNLFCYDEWIIILDYADRYPFLTVARNLKLNDHKQIARKTF